MALPYPFQAAVFKRDIDTAMTVYARIDALAVMVNDHSAFRVDRMPFGGPLCRQDSSHLERHAGGKLALPVP